MKILKRISPLLIALLLFIPPALAQQRRRASTAKPPAPAPVPKPGPAFEDVLATDSYRIYVEIRGVGQLLKTPSFSDLLEPIIKLASPPKEFKTLLAWMNSQADTLMTSRMMAASWSVRPNVPKVLLAIEFASPEEAMKFEPRLKSFLPKIMPTPSPTPVPESSPQPGGQLERKTKVTAELQEDQTKEAAPAFVVKQAGSIVYVSDSSFTFAKLRPAGSKLLTEDPNFRRVHDRFSTESVLVFVDTAGMKHEDEERRRQAEEEFKRTQTEAAQAQVNPEPNEPEETETSTSAYVPTDPNAPPEQLDPDVVPQNQIQTSTHTQVDLTNEPPPPPPNVGDVLVGRMGNLLFSGQTILPEAVGVALAFEPDNYTLRVLLANEPEAKGNPVPFIPQLISGPPITPEAASLFPSDTQLFVTLSLDYLQIYDGMVKTLADQTRRGITPAVAEAPEESPFAIYEKRTGIKFKEDLIPMLGNEVALMLPLESFGIGPTKSASEPPPTGMDSEGSKPTSPPSPSPVIAIAVRDRDGVRAVIPKIVDSFVVKGASLLAQTEKRGDTEIVSYADTFAYAFIGNFLLVSPNAKEIQKVVDSYLNHDTLGSVTQFRIATRWQPRQVLGQVYLSPKLMEDYRDFARTSSALLTDQLAELLSRVGPSVEPVTYALSNEGLGPMHELRLPRNLALLMLASMFGTGQTPSAAANESLAQNMLRTIAAAETSLRATRKDGSYGSIDELITAGLIPKEMLEKSGYRIELSVSGSRYEATAVPVEYGKTGRLSFFIDESNVLRGGDHGGGPATVADKPIE